MSYMNTERRTIDPGTNEVSGLRVMDLPLEINYAAVGQLLGHVTNLFGTEPGVAIGIIDEFVKGLAITKSRKNPNYYTQAKNSLVECVPHDLYALLAQKESRTKLLTEKLYINPNFDALLKLRVAIIALFVNSFPRVENIQNTDRAMLSLVLQVLDGRAMDLKNYFGLENLSSFSACIPMSKPVKSRVKEDLRCTPKTTVKNAGLQDADESNGALAWVFAVRKKKGNASTKALYDKQGLHAHLSARILKLLLSRIKARVDLWNSTIIERRSWTLDQKRSYMFTPQLIKEWNACKTEAEYKLVYNKLFTGDYDTGEVSLQL